MKKLLAILVPLLFIPIIAHAKISITASLDDNSITSEDVTQITVEVTGKLNIDAPTPPSVQGAKLIQTGRSSQFQIVNGSTSISAVFIYKVIPTEEGKISIGPFIVRAGGKEYKSNSLKLTVTGSSYTAQPPQVIQNPNYSQQQNQSSGNNQTQVPSNEDPLFWITTSVHKKKAYVSEQILFYFKYYSRINPINNNLQLPDFKNFMTEVVLPQKQGTEVVNGIKYSTYEKVIALFPTKKGKLTIDPAKLELTYEVMDNPQSKKRWDPFYYGFGGRRVAKTKVLKSKPIEIEVKDLPQPIPKNFTHLVGEFGMKATLSDSQVKVGDSVSLNVSFNGFGNIRAAVLPNLPLEGIKTYRDKPSLETYQSSQGISGRKTFNVVLVPQKSGEVNISTLDFTYFDPKKGDYVPMTAFGLKFAVQASENDQTTHALITENTGAQGSQEIAYKDLAPLYSNATRALNASVFSINNFLFLVIFWGLPGLFFLVLGMHKIKNGKKGVNHKQRKKGAYKKLSAQLNKRAVTGDDVIEAVQGFMEDYFGVAGQALTAKEMKEVCIKNRVSSPVAAKLEKIMTNLEATQYGFEKQSVITQTAQEVRAVIGEIVG